MKEKQYINYEQATAIAQTGLWDCEDADAVYFDCEERNKHAVPSTIEEIDKLFESDKVEIIVCPRFTLAEAIDWLRDYAGIHVQINNVERKQWSYDLVDINGLENEDGTPYNFVPERETTPIFNTYEEAVSDAIDKAVEIYTPTEEELNMDDSQFPTMSEEEYNKLRDEIENSDMYDGRGKYDVYECEGCDYHLITTYAVKGVTPFVITCPKCGKGMLHVRTLKSAPAGENVIKWIRPTYEQYCKLSYGYRDHIGKGGLILDKKTAEKASKLLKTLERLEEIRQATEESKSHWWSFLTPDVKRLTDNNGLMMPEILRNEFKEAVERAIEKTKAKLDKL